MNRQQSLLRRKERTHSRVREKNKGRARLSVFRSGRNVYAQVIDDMQSKTIVSASTLEKDLKQTVKKTASLAAAEQIGKSIAERALKAGIKEVVFDRGRFLYHGRIKALAEAARKQGLSF